ncbi:hypothetical protein TNCT_457521 [Trichonephila clavata]|uniref:Uncharacterized protein n=1 Tax=Trichonephila clavata TaxID=2740835 RepID=A0A8X6GDJ6_TRICU|nr:hypothetical protein TNCT_457521 [Trichonephila clavata]
MMLAMQKAVFGRHDARYADGCVRTACCSLCRRLCSDDMMLAMQKAVFGLHDDRYTEGLKGPIVVLRESMRIREFSASVVASRAQRYLQLTLVGELG